MEAWLEKNLLEPNFPFRLFMDEGKIPVSHHWHDEIEIIYMIGGNVKVGVNNKMYDIQAGDILLISSGDIHCFLPDLSMGTRIVIQFNLAIFDNFASIMSERKEIRPLFDCSKRLSTEWSTEVKLEMENQIKGIVEEYDKKLDQGVQDKFCEFIGMYTREFWKVMDKWYNKEFFYQDKDGVWHEKFKIGVGLIK